MAKRWLDMPVPHSGTTGHKMFDKSSCSWCIGPWTRGSKQQLAALQKLLIFWLYV